MKKIIVLLAFLALSVSAAHSQQRYSISTNLVGWGYLGTINAEAGIAVTQHWSLMAGYKYNPWTFKKGVPGEQHQSRQQTYNVGFRVWPWHVYSGWWVGAKAQYQEYNRGGLLNRQETEEGDAVGLGISAGYTLMIDKYLNLEFGLGGWGGHTWYTKYSCPNCGMLLESGNKWFLLPNDVLVTIMLVF